MYRTAITTTALTPDERKILRRMAFERETTISNVVRELLLENGEFSRRLLFLHEREEKNANMDIVSSAAPLPGGQD